MIRYVIALIIAALIILAGVLFVRQTYAEIETPFEQQRQKLKQQKANGTLPKEWQDVDLDTMKYSDFAMPVSTGFQIRWDLTMWLVEFWWFFIPLVAATCLGAAWLFGRVFHRRA
jgi:hypothetical protein